MSSLVALHTQALDEPAAGTYLELLGRALRSARLSKAFPDRRRLAATLQALGPQCHRGLYERLYIDSRAGLPNLASLTRVNTDQIVGQKSLAGYDEQEVLDARRGQAEVFDRIARKRRYYEALGVMQLAPVDEHRVLLRRHEPELSRASFRVELTKLEGSGTYLRVVIELTQTLGLWANKLIELDDKGEVASGTDALRNTVYRFAGLDAETLFVRLHELEGVAVERVQRGSVGPVLFALPGGAAVVEPHPTAMVAPWSQWLAAQSGHGPQMVTSFATDVAAVDVRQERSNDPFTSLLADRVGEQERARYDILRQRHPFRVYKDRKFVATRDLVPVVKRVCEAAGTRNLIYAC